MFEQSVLPAPRTRATSLAFSLGAQAGLLGLGLIAPLIYFQQLGPVEYPTITTTPNLAPVPREFVKTMSRAAASAVQLYQVHPFLAPTHIPRATPVIEDPGIEGFAAPTEFRVGSGSGLGPSIDALRTAPPPPEPLAAKPPEPVKKPTGPLRVGGNVMSAKLIHQVKPFYPPLARNARVSGAVKLTATIGRDGAIQNLQLLSGHPLLVNAALTAVRQWRYQPTLLNGEPVEVLTQIDVNFNLQ
jgi:protein TonB